MVDPRVLKPLDFIGSSREDLREFPDEAKQDIGYALFEAQQGRTSEAAKPLKGFGGGVRGIKTPRHDIELIRRRLNAAEEDYRTQYQRGG